MEQSFVAALEAFAFIGRMWVKILPIDFLRYALGAGGVFLLVNVALGRALARRKIRESSPDGAQMRREFITSMRTVAIFALMGAITIVGGREIGLISIDADVATRGWVYFAFNCAALIILHDAWFYWTHRLIHHPRLFRRAHRTHHKSRNPSPFTAYFFDSAEAFINAAYLSIAVILIPTSTLAIFVFLVHMILRNAIGHCGYEIFPQNRHGRPLFDWMTSVTHHDLHHAQAGWNYGLYFTWWDRLMGTEHPLYHEKFSEAVGTPLDGSAVRAMRTPAAALLLTAIAIASIWRVSVDTALAFPDAAPVFPEGVFATEGHGAHVVFERCANEQDKLCGRMVWSWDEELLAPGDSLAFLGDFEWDGERWADGWLASPEDGRTYRGKITPLPDGALKLKGCALVFCQTQIWRRVDDIPGCVAAKEGMKKAGRNTPPGFSLIAI